jgi:hypothetical protein
MARRFPGLDVQLGTVCAAFKGLCRRVRRKIAAPDGGNQNATCALQTMTAAIWKGPAMNRPSTAIRIADLIYDAARRRFEAVVEFFAPGMPLPLRVPVALAAPQNLPHARLTRALAQEAARRGIGGV